MLSTQDKFTGFSKGPGKGSVKLNRISTREQYKWQIAQKHLLITVNNWGLETLKKKLAHKGISVAHTMIFPDKRKECFCHSDCTKNVDVQNTDEL